MATVAPTLFLAVWAGTYLLSCFAAVIDQRRPLDVLLPTEKGAARLRARVWSLDLSRRRIVAYGVQLNAPNGELLASAEQVVADGPTDAREGFAVWARGLSARLERMPDGRWRHLDLLPPETKEPGATPFEVHLESGKVRVTDRTGAQPWSRTIEARDLRFAGVGTTWLASFDLKIEGAGDVSGHVRNAPGTGVSLEAKTAGLNVGPILSHLRDSLEGRRYGILKKIEATELAVNGQGRAAYAENGRLSLAADFSAKGRNAGYGRDYHAQEFAFTGSAVESGLKGRLTFTEGGGSGTLAGSMTWDGPFAAAGKLEFAAAGPRTLPKWLRDLLPRELNFDQGKFNGWVSYGGASSFQVDGDVTARAGSWADQRFANPVVRLLANDKRVGVQVLQAGWFGGAIEGRIDVDLKGGGLAGMARTRGTSLSKAGRFWGRDEVSGLADLEAVLGGSTSAPEVAMRMAATASLALPERPETILGNVDAAGRFESGILRVDRMAVVGPNGVVTGHGTYNTRSDKVDFRAFGNGILVSAIQPGQEGTALADVRITGKAKVPVAQGRVEVFGAKVRDQVIPFLGGELAWDGKKLSAKDLVATKGVTSARGDVSWRPSDGTLEGKFTAGGVLLRDWLRGEVGGALSVTSATLGGTVGKPVLSANVEGRLLAVQGVEIDELRSRLHLAGNKVVAENVSLKLDGGELTANGSYDLKSGAGTFKGIAKDVKVDRFLTATPVKAFLADAPAGTSASGLLSGEVAGTLADGRLTSLDGAGSLKDASVNNASLGSGDWQFKVADDKISGSALIGLLERFIEVPKFEYDMRSGEVDAEFTTYRLTLQNVLAALSPLTKNASPETAYRLASLEGAVDMKAAVTGRFDDPNVNLEVFKAGDLKYSGQAFGEINLTAKRGKGKWDVAGLSWVSEDGLMVASGTIEEAGEISLDGEISGFRLGKLGILDPAYAKLAGRADVPFIVSGLTRGPEIRASLKGRSFGLASEGSDGTGPTVFDLNLTSIFVRPGSIEAEGGFVYRGIEGKVVANLPFEYPFSIPDDRPVHAEISLPGRTLTDLAEYAPWLDVDNSVGTIQGSIGVGGTIGDLSTFGTVSLLADKLAYKKQVSAKEIWRPETSLKDVRAEVSLKDRSITVDVAGRSSKGGTMAAHLSTGRLNPLDVLQGATEQLLSTTLTGSAELAGFSFGENWGPKGQLAFEADGKISVSGSIRRPSIAGTLAFYNAVGVAPTEFAAAEEGAAPTIDPRFDIALNLAEGSRVRASTADFLLHGSGSVKGSLSRPVAAMNLSVEKGTVRLPNARIKIQEGGQMRFAYRVAQDGTATPRLDIDLNGETSVTAMRFGDTLERYNLSLLMTGNILAEGQMHIAAQSDPPDLSQERIMAILGQGDFLQGLAQGSENTLASFAIPAVIDPFAEKLAAQLGLEYVSLEYDLWQRTTVTAARTLGGGFSIMGRRQILQSGIQRELYDFRLSYRLPVRNQVWRSFSLGLGTDQDRPWKFTMEYGRRF